MHIMDVNIAREKVLEQERLRPGRGQFSALWEGGQSWRHAFDELVAAERARDTLFEQLVDAASGFDARRDRLQQWSGSLLESMTWYGQLGALLREHQNLWNTDEQGNSLAPNELFAHRALLDVRSATGAAHRTLVELEFLEYRRRHFGWLNEDEWQQAWSELLQAFRQQGSLYRNWYGTDLPGTVYVERLSWCQRLQRLQAETREWWGEYRDVDRAGLLRDAAVVDRMVESLRPRYVSSRKSFGSIVGVAIVLVILAVLFSGGGGSNKTPTAELAGIAGTGQTQAAAAPVGDQQTLNQEGKALLQQGRCEEALARFQAAFDANPTAHDAYEPLNNMAFCLYDLDRKDEAIANWLQALSIEPNSPDANAGLGMAFYTTGRQDDGIAFYRAALGINAGYADEEWLRTVALWSEHAIADSRAIRAASIQ